MFAAKGLEAQFMDRLNVYATAGIALVAIAVLIWLILRIRGWFFESEDSDEPLEEMLTQFRQLKRDGELSEEEYRLISQRLAGHPTAANPVQTVPQSTSNGASPESPQSTDPPVS
ncbi:MAG: hypothetical protein V4719_15140 [Planctomycetota bacterium]